MSDQVYLNGQYLERSRACIPVMDRGFLFGDGVYEVIPVYQGHPFRLEQHLDRLEDSLTAVELPNPLGREQWAEVFRRVVEANGGGDQGLYLQVTRGAADKRNHAFPDGVEPTVFVMTTPIPAPDLEQPGIEAATVEDIRWLRCDIKSTSLLANVLLRQGAESRGSGEAILVRDGEAVEGAASNLFLVMDGEILTPPKDERILPGITRDLVVELAHQHELPCRETAIDREWLDRAEEIWVTSSTKEIVPVVRLDGKPVGEGRPGKLWRRMVAYYQEYKQTFLLKQRGGVHL